MKLSSIAIAIAAALAVLAYAAFFATNYKLAQRSHGQPRPPPRRLQEARRRPLK